MLIKPSEPSTNQIQGGQKKGYRNCKNSIWDKFDKNTTKHTINRYMYV